MDDFVFGLVFVIIIGTTNVFMFKVIDDTSYNRGFKDGQVSAINGDIKYELQPQSDSALIWVRKD